MSGIKGLKNKGMPAKAPAFISIDSMPEPEKFNYAEIEPEPEKSDIDKLSDELAMTAADVSTVLDNPAISTDDLRNSAAEAEAQTRQRRAGSRRPNFRTK